MEHIITQLFKLLAIYIAASPSLFPAVSYLCFYITVGLHWYEVNYFLCDGTVRNQQQGEGTMKQLEEEGLQPEFLPLDVDSEESIRTAKETVKKKYGRLDLLINNAGVLLNVTLVFGGYY